METDGWTWLIENNSDFVDTIKGGIDILIAPHHGHKSGFPSALFEITGDVKVVIHSKGSEGNIEGTDVSTQYSENAEGVNYKNLNDKEFYRGKVLTTRSNGNIYIQINRSNFTVWASKASPNCASVSVRRWPSSKIWYITSGTAPSVSIISRSGLSHNTTYISGSFAQVSIIF